MDVTPCPDVTLLARMKEKISVREAALDMLENVLNAIHGLAPKRHRQRPQGPETTYAPHGTVARHALDMFHLHKA